jgi:hypothetical protein
MKEGFVEGKEFVHELSFLVRNIVEDGLERT